VLAVPVQAPLHPANTEPAEAEAVNVTTAPDPNSAVQLVPQLIPAGLDVTVPVPAPSLATDRPKAGTVAVALPLFPSLVAVMVAVPGPTPVTSPLPLTVATLELLEDQFTVRPPRVCPPPPFKATANWCAPPTVNVTLEGETSTSDTVTTSTMVSDSQPRNPAPRHPAKATAHHPRRIDMAPTSSLDPAR